MNRATKRMVPLIPDIDPARDSKGSPWPGIKLEHFQVKDMTVPEVLTTSFLAALCLSADACATLTVSGKYSVVKPHAMIVASPGKIPAHQSDGNVEFLLLEVAPRYFMWAAEESVAEDHFDPDQYRQLRDDQLRHILLAIHHELLTGFPSGRLFGEYMGLAFATTVLARYSEKPLRTGSYRGGLSPAKLRVVKAFVNENLAGSLTLTGIANLVQVGPCHFARAFKESTGLSPHQYVLRCRINRALKMLRDGHTSLAGIAYDVGFSSQGHFTTVFRKVTGTQPGNYRDRLRFLKEIGSWNSTQFPSGGPVP